MLSLYAVPFSACATIKPRKRLGPQSDYHFAFTPLDSSFPTAQNSVCMCEGTDAVDFR